MCGTVPDWSLWKEAKLDPPSKGRILLMQTKFTGLWLKPANKPIEEHFIRKATGHSNGDSKHNRSTSMWLKEPRSRVWIKKGLTCTSSETGPCAASSAGGHGSLCRWGQRAEIPSGDSSLVLVGPPKTCRRVRGAGQWDRRQTRAHLEGTLTWHTFRVGLEELRSYTLRLQSHCQVESIVSDFGFTDTSGLENLAWFWNQNCIIIWDWYIVLVVSSSRSLQKTKVKNPPKWWI